MPANQIIENIWKIRIIGGEQMGVSLARAVDSRESRLFRIIVRLLILFIMIILLGYISIPVKALESNKKTFYIECPLSYNLNASKS